MLKLHSIPGVEQDFAKPQVLILGKIEALKNKLDFLPKDESALDCGCRIGALLAPECETVLMQDAQELLGNSSELRPDLIIAGLDMPGNEQFLRQLRARSVLSRIPVLLLIAPANRKCGARLLLDGAQDYLVTPFLPEELRARAGNLIAMKLAQDKADQNTSRVQEANQELESFSYSVSHDLKAPLRAMQGMANALLEDYANHLDATGQDYARRIVTASKRMDQLVSDLLNYSRLTRGDLQIKPISLQEIVDEAHHQLEAEFAQKQVQLKMEAAPIMAFGQYTILAQVICNLLSNAIKFVADGVRPSISVLIEEKGNWARLSVKDNGIGIPREDHERIFRVFERLHTSSAYPGTGIGLAIVAKGIKRLGGRFGVISEPGQGSTFWLELPKAAPEA
jgi:signal transduction histidine kinase